MNKEKEFWNWFKENNAKYFFLNQVEDEEEKQRLLDLFLKKLHQYSTGLYFLIGGHPDEEQDLIITAEGNKEFFSKVEELVKAAPKLKDWNIIAFKPPVEEGFIITHKGIEFDPNKMWFVSLENEEDLTSIGLKIYFEDFSNDREKDFLMGAYLVLDNILGEKSSTLDIDYVEVHIVPTNRDEEGLIELTELPSYIKWLRSK
jgi:hypothetical protein